MKIILTLLIATISFSALADDFLQVYKIDDNGYYIVECESRNGKSTCRLRKSKINELCVLTNKVTDYGEKNVKYSKKDFTWTITENVNEEYCEINSTYLVSGATLIIETNLVKGKHKICKMFNKMKFTFPRLTVGLNPTLSTRGCSDLVILY